MPDMTEPDMPDRQVYLLGRNAENGWEGRSIRLQDLSQDSVLALFPVKYPPHFYGGSTSQSKQLHGVPMTKGMEELRAPLYEHDSSLETAPASKLQNTTSGIRNPFEDPVELEPASQEKPSSGSPITPSELLKETEQLLEQLTKDAANLAISSETAKDKHTPTVEDDIECPCSICWPDTIADAKARTQAAKKCPSVIERKAETVRAAGENPIKPLDSIPSNAAVPNTSAKTSDQSHKAEHKPKIEVPYFRWEWDQILNIVPISVGKSNAIETIKERLVSIDRLKSSDMECLRSLALVPSYVLSDTDANILAESVTLKIERIGFVWSGPIIAIIEIISFLRTCPAALFDEKVSLCFSYSKPTRMEEYYRGALQKAYADHEKTRVEMQRLIGPRLSARQAGGAVIVPFKTGILSDCPCDVSPADREEVQVAKPPAVKANALAPATMRNDGKDGSFPPAVEIGKKTKSSVRRSSYGIPKDVSSDEPNLEASPASESGATTATISSTTMPTLPELSRMETPTYINDLLEQANHTTASTRLLRIMRDEKVKLDSSIGLKLLDLVQALKSGGELSPINVDAQPSLPTSASSLQSMTTVETKPSSTSDLIKLQIASHNKTSDRLNEFAGMLNAIAEAVGVNLQEADDSDDEATVSPTVPNNEDIHDQLPADRTAASSPAPSSASSVGAVYSLAPSLPPGAYSEYLYTLQALQDSHLRNPLDPSGPTDEVRLMRPVEAGSGSAVQAPGSMTTDTGDMSAKDNRVSENVHVADTAKIKAVADQAPKNEEHQQRTPGRANPGEAATAPPEREPAPPAPQSPDQKIATPLNQETNYDPMTGLPICALPLLNPVPPSSSKDCRPMPPPINTSFDPLVDPPRPLSSTASSPHSSVYPSIPYTPPGPRNKTNGPRPFDSLGQAGCLPRFIPPARPAVQFRSGFSGLPPDYQLDKEVRHPFSIHDMAFPYVPMGGNTDTTLNAFATTAGPLGPLPFLQTSQSSDSSWRTGQPASHASHPNRSRQADNNHRHCPAYPPHFGAAHPNFAPRMQSPYPSGSMAMGQAYNPHQPVVPVPFGDSGFAHLMAMMDTQAPIGRYHHQAALPDERGTETAGTFGPNGAFRPPQLPGWTAPWYW